MGNDIYRDCSLDQICPLERKYKEHAKKEKHCDANKIVELFYKNIGSFSVFTTNNEGIAALKKTFNEENEMNFVVHNDIRYDFVIEKFNDVYCSYSPKEYNGRIKEIYSTSYATYKITIK